MAGLRHRGPGLLHQALRHRVTGFVSGVGMEGPASRPSSRLRRELGVRLPSEPQVSDAPQVEEVASRVLHDTYEGVVAASAAQDRADVANVSHLLAHVRDRATPVTGALGGGRLEHEYLAQQSACGVSVQPVFAHRYPPVGPKRSVFMRPASCPSPTSPVATDSTSGVGPQTKVSGPCSLDGATSASISSSMRRA